MPTAKSYFAKVSFLVQYIIILKENALWQSLTTKKCLSYSFHEKIMFIVFFIISIDYAITSNC